MKTTRTTEVEMPALLDVTHPGPISGSGATSIWNSTSAQSQVTVAEASVYFVQERETRWSLERSETGWIAADGATGIFGCGAGPNDAIVDLVHALREHREVLERQDELSPDLADQLVYLQRS
jgi:hypothetical protein